LVKITYKPFKELIIMDYTQYPNPEILATNLTFSIQSGQSVSILWSEGVAFIPAPIHPDTELIAKEYLEGRIIWPAVVFSIMSTYKKSIKVGALELPLIDVSSDPILQQAALWLKKRAKNK
jgi:hypothetical protein